MPKKELTRLEKIKVLSKYLSVPESTIESHLVKGDLESFVDKRSSEVEFLRSQAPKFIKESRRDLGKF